MTHGHEQYTKTREDFDRLSLEERASFLVEAAFSTAAEALEQTGRGIADVVNEMQRRAEERRKSRSEGRESDADTGNETDE